MIVHPKLKLSSFNHTSSEYSSNIHLFLFHVKKKIHMGLEEMNARFFILGWAIALSLLNCERSTSERLNSRALGIYVCVSVVYKYLRLPLSLSTVFPHSPFTIWATVWCCFPRGDSEHAEDFSYFSHPFHWRFPPPVWRRRMDYGTSRTHGSVTFALSPPSTHTHTAFRV